MDSNYGVIGETTAFIDGNFAVSQQSIKRYVKGMKGVHNLPLLLRSYVYRMLMTLMNVSDASSGTLTLR